MCPLTTTPLYIRLAGSPSGDEKTKGNAGALGDVSFSSYKRRRVACKSNNSNITTKLHKGYPAGELPDSQATGHAS